MAYINNALNNTSNQDFTVTTATAGVDRALTVSNSDNTAAASAAHTQITVGGSTSTGDPYTNYLVTGAGTFSLGIDNSDSDKFKITNGASTSAGTDLFQMDSSGNANFSAGSVSVYSSHAGALHSLEVYNTDTANPASDTMISARAYGFGGVSAVGDPYIYVVVSGTNGYAIGIDNSDGDTFKIVNNGGSAATPSTGNTLLSITPAGLVTVPYNNFSVTRDTAGAGTVLATISNTSNTAAASNAELLIQNGGTTSTGDPYINLNIPGGGSYSVGVDNSDSDRFKISASNAIGTTDAIVVTTAGEVLTPLQPKFQAYNAATIVGLLGDGAYHTIAFNTEYFDTGADYDVNTGIFTASVTGYYRFSTHVQMCSLGAGNTDCIVKLNTTTGSMAIDRFNPVPILQNNRCTFGLSCMVYMAAGDTAYISGYASGAGLTVDIGGNNAITPGSSGFEGELIS